MSWEVLYVIPNISIQDPFDTEYLSIVPYGDQRIRRIIAANATAAALLNGFRSETGTRIKPSAIICREDSPESVVNLNAVVDFRNIYAVSCLVSGNARAIISQNITEPVYSDYFDFYPLTLRRNRRGLIIDSPALLGLWPNPRRVYGSTYAHIFISDIIRANPDQVLLTKLIKQWNYRYRSPAKNSWITRILFRSLEIAYQALLSPFRSSRIYEYGTHLSLWVSSFETLVQGRREKYVGFKDVLSLLRGFVWGNKELNNRKYWTAKLRTAPRGSLVMKIYLEIYNARNSFLHGNPVTPKTLYPFGNMRLPTLPTLAPIIYWAALSKFLPILFHRKYVDRIGWAFRESLIEHDYEEALSSVIEQ